MRGIVKAGIFGGLVAAAIGAKVLLGKKEAGDKLIVNLKSFDATLGRTGLSLGAIKLPKGATFKIVIEAANPSNTSLDFSQPFARVYATNKKGERVEIGDSKTSSAQISIPANDTKDITLDVNVPLTTMLSVFPDYLQYAWGRMNGEKSTRKLDLVYTYTAYGIEQSGNQSVNI